MMTRGGTLTGTLTGALIALALVATAVPTAQAHVAEDPLDIEVQLLADEGEDAFYWYDGYDLYNLFVREAYWDQAGEEGLIYRFTLYGGFAPGEVSENLHIDITQASPANETTLRLSTADDASWSGDLQMVAFNVTPDAPPFTGVTARIQAFVPYSALGVDRGGTLSGFTMASYADDDLRDIAPGPFYLPNSQGMAEVPAGESERLVEELELQGPVGYVTYTPTVTGDRVSLAVKNPLSEAGQHVEIIPQETPGWTVNISGPSAVSLDPGASGTLELSAHATDEATRPLPVMVASDLGGLEWFYIGVNGTQLQTASTDQVDVAPQVEAQESPLPAPLALVAILGAAVALVRRRR